MNSYALTLLIKPDLEEKARRQLLESVTQQMDGVKKEDLWGGRDLAYPIKKQNKAYYAHFEFEADPKSISSLDKSLKLEEDVLRYLLVRVEI